MRGQEHEHTHRLVTCVNVKIGIFLDNRKVFELKVLGLLISEEISDEFSNYVFVRRLNDAANVNDLPIPLDYPFFG